MKADEYKPSLKKNIVFSFVIQAICYLVPILVSPYLTRILGAENIGIYSFSYSYAHYFAIFASFGFISFGTKLISEQRNNLEKRNEIFWGIFFTRIVFVLISALVYIILVLTSAFPGINNQEIMLVFIILIGSTVFDITYLFRGIEKLNVITLCTALVNLLYIASIFLFVKTANDLLLFTIFKVLSLSLVYVFLWFFAFKRINKPVFKWKIVFTYIKQSFFFFLPTLVMSISGSLDQTFIGIFSTKTEVAYYQQVLKITVLLAAIIQAIAPVILSRIALLNKEGEERIQEIRDLTGKVIELALFIIAPIVTGLYIVGNIFIPLYFGDEFINAVPVLYTLLPVAIFSSLSAILISAYYYVLNKTKQVTIVILIGVVINITLTIILLNTTSLGAVAAAIGSVVSEAFIFIVLLIGARKRINFSTVSINLIKITIASTLMCGVLIPLNIFVLTAFITQPLFVILIDVAIGVIIYFLTLILSKELLISSFINKLMKRKQK